MESQHITHYGSMINPDESPRERMLLQEACEVWNYAACVEQESNPRVKAVWERFLDYELGHLQAAIALFQQHDRAMRPSCWATASSRRASSSRAIANTCAR